MAHAFSKKIPTHLAIIMDGNRRFAKSRGLPSFEGHRIGYEVLKNVGDWCLELGIQHLTVYGFSTENWKRSPEEVTFLFDLFHRAVTEEISYFKERNVRLRILGERNGLPEKLVSAFKAAEETTKDNVCGNMNIAINYSGRHEILLAAKRALQSGLAPDTLDETNFGKLLFTADLPDPDLVIRTSGEQRLSNFLLWQSAYSEIYFEQKHWPEFSRADLEKILLWYGERERRLGK